MSKYRICFVVEDDKDLVFKPQVRKWFLWWDVGTWHPDIEYAKIRIKRLRDKEKGAEAPS